MCTVINLCACNYSGEKGGKCPVPPPGICNHFINLYLFIVKKMNNIKTFVKILQNVTQHECFNIQIEIKHTISILKKKKFS